MEADSKHQYSIGVVARRTQMHPETLRVWERRYELIVPERTDTGRRLYSEGDILKVSLVKQLTERGHAVSSVAKLPIDRLRDMLNASGSVMPEQKSPPRFKRRVMFLDDTLRLRIGPDLLRFEDIEIVDRSTGHVGSAVDKHADVVVFDIVTINEKSLDQIRKALLDTGGIHGLVIYKFATRASVEQLERAGIICLKGMVTASEVYRVCCAFPRSSINLMRSTAQPPVAAMQPRRFDNAQLARVANLSGTIACECPNHLAELIINLAAFEQYSSECASRNVEDAQLHAQLNQSAAMARGILEDSLARLIEIEGIKI
ncbi:MAG: MerR family transcriptional regulator [Betaproteobacteria bacterium]